MNKYIRGHPSMTSTRRGRRPGSGGRAQIHVDTDN